MLRLYDKARRDINKGSLMLGMATDDVAMTWNPQPETPMTLKLGLVQALQSSMLQGRQGLPACKGVQARV